MSRAKKPSLTEQLADANAKLAALAQSVLDAQAKQSAAPVTAAPQAATVVMSSTVASVGIRNISSYTIGFHSPTFGEIQLSAAHPGHHDPQSSVQVPHAWWMSIRNSKEMKRGMIIRDDSILGEGVPRAPEDQANQLPSSWAVNAIIDPFEWIESRTEVQLREDISKITSEPSVRRLMAAVDEKIRQIGQESYRDDPNIGKKALRDLPSIYVKVDELTTERLDELSPLHGHRAEEREQKIRFAS